MAAAELFADRGLDDTKTEDIAAATGIPKATIYYYFEGKEEVLSFIFGVVLDAVHEAVTGAIAGPGTGAERLARVIEAHLHVFAEYPKASQALHFDLGRAARMPGGRGAVERVVHRTRDRAVARRASRTAASRRSPSRA